LSSARVGPIIVTQSAMALPLGVLLRSVVAPWYLALTVGFSYLASLGFAMIGFVHPGGQVDARLWGKIRAPASGEE
jgi:uncharacterized membrane protein YdfJ with MMPL/SSD domain